MMRELFYRILNSGLWGGGSRSEGFSVSDRERRTLFEMGRLQAVSGVLAIGMDECGVDLGSDRLSWVKTLMYIEKRGKKIDLLARKIVEELADEGMTAEVFKGPSVAKWYRKPEARSFGDIDIVVMKGAERIEEVLRKWGIGYKREHEDVVCMIERINVEFHHRRDYVYCPKDNRVLQRLVKEYPESAEVYLVCVMVHLRRHILTYGMGMKQVCDVAVMLRNAELDMEFLSKIIKELHMERFCAALFGFLKRCLEVEVFPIEPDCGRNSVFIEETVWRDGYLLKIERENRSKGLPALRRVAGNAWFWVKRSVRMSVVMPREAAWFIPYMVKRRVSVW